MADLQTLSTGREAMSLTVIHSVPHSGKGAD
jgi:hypothetical protein